MGDRLPSAWIDELRSRTDIVQIVSETVHLKQNGGRYWGLCPFHNEKTASFSVSQDQQMYYCFGCKAGGNVITFVMETERIGFMDALRYLAERANFPIPEQSFDTEEYQAKRTERERILELNRSAARFFHERLWKVEGAEILEYFHRRGLDDAAIRRYGLGASPEDGRTLIRAIAKQDDDADLMVKAGLCGQKDGRVFDFFRSRAMFPILSARGEVLAFGGRALGDAQPKYLNTSDTPVFNKRQGVYGVHLLKTQRSLKRLVLVEGYMDALSLLTHDVNGVVATLGTSLTPEQIKLMSRYAPEIWIAYDGDDPGQKAALRAVDMCDEYSVPSRVVLFPDQMDPDEYIRSGSHRSFDELERLSPPQFRLRRLVRGYDLSSPEDRMSYAMAAAKVLRAVQEPVELENLLGRLVIETDYPREVLIAQIERSRMETPRHERTVSAFKPVAKRTSGTSIPALNAHELLTAASTKAARVLLSLMATHTMGNLRIEPGDFVEPVHRDIAARIASGQSLASIQTEYMDNPEWRAESLEIYGIPAIVEDERVPQMIIDLIEKMKQGRIDTNIMDIRPSLNAEQGAARAASLSKVLSMLQEKQGLKSGRKE